jgi:tubulin polyglutamylase TTLL5
LKSRTGSKGAGIILSNNSNEIYKNESRLVQRYIEDPLLLDGINRHKFDIRLWVLVTGFKSIEIYYHKAFYGRISSQKYNCEPEQIRNEFIHLTNYSVNKCKYEEADNMQESIIFNEDIFELIRYEYGVDYQASFYCQI